MSSQNPVGQDRVAALEEIWRKVLRNPGLDKTSDIFESGGHSLHVLQIVGQIYDVLGLDLQLRHVFTYSTPQTLSEFLDTTPEQEGAWRR